MPTMSSALSPRSAAERKSRATAGTTVGSTSATETIASAYPRSFATRSMGKFGAV